MIIDYFWTNTRAIFSLQSSNIAAFGNRHWISRPVAVAEYFLGGGGGLTLSIKHFQGLLNGLTSTFWGAAIST